MALSSTFLNPLISSVTFNRQPKITTSTRKGFRVNCAVETETTDVVPATNYEALAANAVIPPTPVLKSKEACEKAATDQEIGLSTVLVNYHADWDTLKATSTPIYLNATFKMKSAKEFGPYGYSRSDNPSRDALEKLLAHLDHAEYAYCFSTRMAALYAVCELVDNDDEIIAIDDLYGGSYNFINNLLARKKGIKVNHVDTSNLDNVRKAMTDKTKLIWLESPSNPLLKISDIQAIADIAHSKDAILFIDNSVMSPVLSQPLDHGADIVMNSATKFVGGNSSCMGGSLATNDKQLAEKIKAYRNATGCGLSPFDSWICLEGIKTMDLRVERKQETAIKIAEFLASQEKVITQVTYPGLYRKRSNTSPDPFQMDKDPYDLHNEQSHGPGSVISFRTNNPKLSEHIVEKTKYFSMTTNFDGVGSTICLPWYICHGSVSDQQKRRMGITKDLVRISVGIEKFEDLKKDLENAISSFGKNCCCC